LGEPLTEEEKEVLKPLLVEAKRPQQISDTLHLPLETVYERIARFFARLQAALGPAPDPRPPSPSAAAAALAVPMQRDIPKHVGRPLRSIPSRRD
jgi:DNA-binding NarL/FixJ family response regulator